MADFEPLFAQDSIEIIYPGQFSDAEIVACEDLGVFWVKSYPLGYRGERAPWVINGTLMMARLAKEGSKRCDICLQRLDAEWPRDGHLVGCYMFEHPDHSLEETAMADPARTRPKTATARGRRTEVHPIGLPGFEYKAFERTEEMPTEPWWVIDLGPGMNPLELGHDEFLLIFRESVVPESPNSLLGDLLAWDATTDSATDLLSRSFDMITSLDANLDRTQLLLIESQNPGIDMDEVRATRAGRRGEAERAEAERKERDQ